MWAKILPMVALTGCLVDRDLYDAERARLLGDSAADSGDSAPPDGEDRDGDGSFTPADCDDGDPAVNPDAAEVCNGVDDDCDGETDPPGSPGEVAWYVDEDGDGYGTTEGGVACAPPDGGALLPGDCADDDALRSPGVIEDCDNAVDDDCDGAVDSSSWYRDFDGDGHGDPAVRRVECLAPEGFVADGDDCADDVAAQHPGAEEVCGNKADDDCDGLVDDGCNSVLPTYPGVGEAWGQYVRTADPATPCDGMGADPEACWHGGERRTWVSKASSCEGLDAVDALGAFQWACEEIDGFAVFRSTGFAPGKGLGDLLDAGGFFANSVTASDGSESFTSGESVWWPNTVRSLPDNANNLDPDPGRRLVLLDQPGSIYVVSGDRATQGVTVAADGVSLVVLPGSRLRWAGSSLRNCDAQAAVGSVYTCVLAAPGRKYLWIEGDFTAGNPQGQRANHVLRAYNARYLRLHRAGFSGAGGSCVVGRFPAATLTDVQAVGCAQAGFELEGEGLHLTGVRVAGNGGSGLDLTTLGVTGALVEGLRAAQNVGAGARLVRFDNGVLLDAVALGNGSGVVLEDGGRATLLRLTAVGNTGDGVRVEAGVDPVISLVLSAGNGGDGLVIDAGGVVDDAVLAQLALTGNGGAGVRLSEATDQRVIGNLLVGGNTAGDCVIDGAGGLVDGTCTLSGADGSADQPEGSETTARLRLDREAAAALVGPIDADDPENDGDDVLGQAPAPTGPFDWWSFAADYRVWSGAAALGPCAPGGTCAIVDLSLRAADGALRGTTGDGATPNGAFVAGAPCPAATGQTAPSARAPVDVFALAATEALRDGVGDDDGLCESQERCVYAGNFGAYQGDGAVRICTFTDGDLTGVTMSGFGVDGR